MGRRVRPRQGSQTQVPPAQSRAVCLGEEEMMKKKLAVSIALAVSAALSMGVGCKKDEKSDDGDGDTTACEELCAASTECGEKDVCLAECADVTESCPEEVEAYLECAEGNTDIECFEQTALGISVSCGLEAAAIQLCAIPGGDGDGDTGGTSGDGDGDTGGTSSTGGQPPLGGNGGEGGEGGEGGATD